MKLEQTTAAAYRMAERDAACGSLSGLITGYEVLHHQSRYGT